MPSKQSCITQKSQKCRDIGTISASHAVRASLSSEGHFAGTGCKAGKTANISTASLQRKETFKNSIRNLLILAGASEEFYACNSLACRKDDEGHNVN